MEHGFLIDISMITVVVLIIALCIAEWKYQLPKEMLIGSAGIIVYVGFVSNELGKGVDLDLAIYKFPIIGIVGLLFFIIGLLIMFKK